MKCEAGKRFRKSGSLLPLQAARCLGVDIRRPLPCTLYPLTFPPRSSYSYRIPA